MDGHSAAQAAESSGPTAESPPAADASVSAEMDGPRRTAGFLTVEIDINSGDLRGTRSMLDGPPRNETFESQLSMEARRLGVPIPEERRWKVISRPFSGGMHITYTYDMLYRDACTLLLVLDQVGASDEERRDTLERLLTSMRNEQPPRAIETAHLLTLEVTDRHKLDSPFLPHHTEYLRQLRRDEETTR
jgi:hypothetical protein